MKRDSVPANRVGIANAVNNPRFLSLSRLKGLRADPAAAESALNGLTLDHESHQSVSPEEPWAPAGAQVYLPNFLQAFLYY